MTVERRMIVGLGDIKAIVLECGKCKARYSLAPESGEIPSMCHCGQQWLFGAPTPVSTGTPLERIIAAIGQARRQMTDAKNRPLAAFTLLFEFEEPKP